MTPRARRILIPIIVAAGALGLLVLVIVSRPRPTPIPSSTAATPTQTADETAGAPADSPDGPQTDDDSLPAVPQPTGDDDDGAADETPTDAGGDEEAADPEPAPPLESLRAVAPETGVRGHETPPATLGSLDPSEANMLVEFSRAGAGISSIVFSDIWETAEAKRQADAHRRNPQTTEAPDPELRYQLTESQVLRNDRLPDGLTFSVLATTRLVVNDGVVNLYDYNTTEDGERSYIWSETAPGEFRTVVRDADDRPILEIVRRFELRDHYDIALEQRVRNLSDRAIDVRWGQLGPADLREDRSRYMDRRRFRFGYVPPQPNAGQLPVVNSNDNDLIFERADVAKRDDVYLWPNETARSRDYELSWFASTNRYFGLAIHPDINEDDPALTNRRLDDVAEILHEESYLDPADPGEVSVVFTHLNSPVRTIEPGGEVNLDIGVYAGPLDRAILSAVQPYPALGIDGLILYQMSACCAVCTFQWLAHLLLWFLSVLHDYLVFDWALAIIVLVIVVRTLLHPLTKKSQVSMQRFGKVMGDLKPEIDKLQKKYPNDPKKVQQEQMKLMRERGVNPFQMLGCLPMFLQMPIWVALYAMLYFTFDLRHQPAFWGLFQLFADWPFLGDLSAPDRFIPLPFEGRLWMIDYGAINILPLLMGAIFYVQQKYMSPPPSPSMSKEQLQQQKMMKVMTVVLFPIMLYSAPSGLTLYILTSSTIGVLESKYIRAHIHEMDLNPKPKQPKKKTKSKDAMGRAYAQALERAEEKRRQKRSGGQKKFKKRK
jgi:YidC/Oxa1 family membrane protein insertase